MTGFLLDTNVPSELIRPQPDQRVKAWVAAQSLDALFLSVVSIGEMHKGISILPPGKRRAELEAWLETDLLKMLSGRILPVTQSIAKQWGVLEGRRQLIGRPIHVPDAQIAATAIEHGLVLVTRNVRDFDDVGVTVINPWGQ